MLFKKEFKTGIRAGRVTRTYRAWKKPQAKVGGQYNLAPDGVISVHSPSMVNPAEITDADAVAAGFADAPWTTRAMQVIASEPHRRAGDLAPGFGWDTPTFKRQIRKLKALGLTESLETGYTLSPRGAQLLAARA